MKAVILHADADAAAAARARAACAMLEPLSVNVTRSSTLFTCGPQIVVVVVWSQAAHAAGLGPRFAKAISGRCGSVVWTIDDAPPLSASATLTLSQFSTDQALTTAVQAAIGRAARSPGSARRLGAAPSILAGLAIGLVVGFGGAGVASREEIRDYAEARSEYLRAQAGVPEPAALTAADEPGAFTLLAENQVADCGHLFLQPVTAALQNNNDFSWLSDDRARCAKRSLETRLG